MALVKQKAAINIGQGIDTKSDSKHVVPGRLTSLVNGVFKKTGRLDKRNGHDSLSNRTVDGSILEVGDSLASYRNELLQYNNQRLYSYSLASERWIDKGSAVSVITKTNQIINNTGAQSACDSAINGNIGVYAWEDSRGGIRGSVIDEDTGMPLLADALISATGSSVRCVSFSAYLFVYYYDSGSLWCSRVVPQSPLAFETPVELSTTVNTTNPTYDVLNYKGLRMIFAHNVQGSSAIKIDFVNDTPAIIGGVFATSSVAEAGTNAIALIETTGNLVTLAYYNSSNRLRAATLNVGGSVVAGPTTVDSTSDAVFNITGYISSSSGLTLIYEVDQAATYNHFIKTNTYSQAGTAGTPSVFMRSVGLYTKVFSYVDAAGEEQFYFGVAHQSTFQSTYFVVRVDGLIISKQLYSLASGLTRNIKTVSTRGVFYSFSCEKKNRLVSEGGNLFTPTGVSKTTIDFTNFDIFTAAELADTLHIVGGVLSMYDGQGVVEHGFHLYPENITSSQSSSGGSLPHGTSFSAVFVYEWYDNNGKIHRSAPSLAVTQATSGGGGSNHTVTFTVPTLRLTAKNGITRSAVRIAGYLDVDGVYYRFTSVGAAANNLLTSDTVNIVLTSANVTANEILYTTGGVLENIPPPACSTISVFKNRVFLGGLEEGGEITYSKEVGPGAPVEFSEVLRKSVEPEGGQVTAFGVLDDKLLIFKLDRFYYTFGDGPNNLGADGDFSELQFVTADVGALSGNSVVRTPRGLMFKSAKGIYLVDSSFGVSYVGSPVEDFNSSVVSSAVLVQDANQVRFTTEDAGILVYDYFFDMWSNFTGLNSKRAVIWQGTYTILKTNGSVFTESDTSYTDAGSSYGMSLETGWLSFDGIGGFQRVYRMHVRGDYRSEHLLQVKVGYDFSPGYESLVVIDPDDLLAISRYGDDSPYGSGSLYGGVNSAYRFEIAMKRQKCESIRFKITEFPGTTGTNEGLSISDLVLLVGIKPGGTKLRQAQAVGAGF